MIIENVNMSDSKRESYWELNSDLPRFQVLIVLITTIEKESKRESYWELNSDQPHFSILVSLIFKEISRSPIELYNSPFIISNYFTFI